MDIDGAQCGPEANNGGRSLPPSYRRDIKEFLMANPPESRLAKVMTLLRLFFSRCCCCAAAVLISRTHPLSAVTCLALILLLLQGIESLIASLKARGIVVYLISGGFRCGREGACGR